MEFLGNEDIAYIIHSLLTSPPAPVAFGEPRRVGCKKFKATNKKYVQVLLCMSYGQSNSYHVIALLKFFTYVRPLRLVP